MYRELLGRLSAVVWECVTGAHDFLLPYFFFFVLVSLFFRFVFLRGRAYNRVTLSWRRFRSAGFKREEKEEVRKWKRWRRTPPKSLVWNTEKKVNFLATYYFTSTLSSVWAVKSGCAESKTGQHTALPFLLLFFSGEITIILLQKQREWKRKEQHR